MAASRDATFRLKTESDASGVDELSAAMARAEAATKKLADPNLTPRQLQRAIVDSTIATDRLKEAMAAAQKTGGPVSADTVAKVKAYETATSKAADQSARYRDALGDQRSRSDAAAKGAEALAGSMSSLEGILGQLKNQTGAVSQGIGEIGFKMVAAAAALKLGYDAGEKVRDAWRSWYGTEMPSLTNSIVSLIYGVDNATGAFDRMGVVGKSAIGIHHQHQNAINELTGKLRELAPEWDKMSNSIKTSNEFGATLSKILHQMALDHQDVAKFAKSHAEVLLESLAPALKAGTLNVMTMSAEMRTAIRAALDQVDAEKQISKAITETTLKIKEKFEAEELAIARKVVAAEKEIAAAELSIQTATKDRDAKIKALKELQLSDEEYNKRKREIVKETADKVAEAEEKEAESKDKVVEAQEEYNKKLAETHKEVLDATKNIEQQAKAYDEVRKAVSVLDEKFDPLMKRLEDVNGAMKKTGGVADETGRQIAALTQKFIELTIAAEKAAGEGLAGSGGLLGGTPGGAGLPSGDVPIA